MPKHVIISKLGGPEVLHYKDYDLPNEIKNKDVRIKHSSIGLNYIDTYHRSGIYPLPSQLPVCPGMEAAGEVIEIGSEVKNFKIGDRVAYATPPIGAYCEIRDFPEEKLISIPEFLTNDEVASVLLQGMTVEYLFERLHKIKKDDFILFHAAAGGVGLIACQWARSVGCRMIGTVGTKEKAELAMENGCEFTINYKEEIISEKVMDITKMEGAREFVDKYAMSHAKGNWVLTAIQNPNLINKYEGYGFVELDSEYLQILLNSADVPRKIKRKLKRVQGFPLMKSQYYILAPTGEKIMKSNEHK